MFKICHNFKKITVCLLWAGMLAGCKTPAPEPEPVEADPLSAASLINLQDPNMIRTPKGASSLDLETPLRCNVNWKTQEMITALPYNMKAFNLTRNGINNPLPRFEVTGFSFKTMPAEKALLKLLKEADIRLVAKDAPYTSISAENLRGELSEVVKMITDAAEIYYNYNAETKTLTISRKNNFTLYVPKSRPIILALLDVLRGSGITNITTDWSDYSITFDADFELRTKIQDLLDYFEENPVLIAYDVSVFTIYPYNAQNDIEWQKLLNIFDFGTIKTAKTGVIGRVLTTSDDLNFKTLQRFLSGQARVVKAAEGKFVVPNLWLGSFRHRQMRRPEVAGSSGFALGKILPDAAKPDLFGHYTGRHRRTDHPVQHSQQTGRKFPDHRHPQRNFRHQQSEIGNDRVYGTENHPYLKKTGTNGKLIIIAIKGD